MKRHRLISSGTCWCVLASLAAVVALPASAGVVPGGLGGVPMGSNSQYGGMGEVTMSDGEVTWTVQGQGNANYYYRSPGVDTGFVSLEHKSVGTSPDPLNLASSARVQAQLLTSGVIRTFGWSLATVNDVVYAQNRNGTVISGFIEFNWVTTGDLKLHASAVDYPLSIRNGVNFGYLAQALTFVNWTDFSGETRGAGVADTLFQRHFLRQDANELQWGGKEWLRRDQVVRGDQAFGPNAMSHEITHHAVASGGVGASVIAFESFPVQIMLGLMTSYNLYAELIDHSGLYIGSEAMFDHTATLESVQFFNPDGTPYLGEWTLVSANGIDYRELIVTDIGAVPLPGTLGLALVGLWPALRMQRTRRGPRMPLARMA